MLTLLWLAAAGIGAARAADDFLDPEQAFRFTARVLDARTIEVGFDVAPGYHLYRDALRVHASGAALDVPELPPGLLEFDPTFRKNVETYRGALRVRLAAPAGRFRVDVTSQGCADEGLCYLPMKSAAEFELPVTGGGGQVRVLAGAPAAH